MVRQTQQKNIIKSEIDKFKTFFSAEDLHREVLKKNKRVGIATIYRHLKNLRKHNLIYSYSCFGKYVYSNSQKSHCHFKCIKTGKTYHFEISSLDFLKEKNFREIISFELNVVGICKDCTKI